LKPTLPVRSGAVRGRTSRRSRDQGRRRPAGRRRPWHCSTRPAWSSR